MNVTIVDYQSGNISSVINSFTEVAKGKVNLEVTADLNKIKSSDKIVLPGQGSFKSCVDSLNSINGLVVDIRMWVTTGIRAFTCLTTSPLVVFLLLHLLLLFACHCFASVAFHGTIISVDCRYQCCNKQDTSDDEKDLHDMCELCCFRCVYKCCHAPWECILSLYWRPFAITHA